jgi:proteasome beta subunit
VKLGFREGLERGDALDLAIRALFTAADDDSATGGPDLVRGIYPTIATITGTGFDKLPDVEIAERFAALLETLASREPAIPGRLAETSTDTSAGTHGGEISS